MSARFTHSHPSCCSSAMARASDTPPEPSSAERARLLRAATTASIGVALGLTLIKAWGSYVTDSVALLASLADSLLDLFASGLTFWAVQLSLSPADAEHRFGHGKSEGLAALVQGIIITASGLFVAREAIARFSTPAGIEQPAIGLLVIVVSAVATGLLVTYQNHVGRKTGSVAIRADALHYRSDLVVNLSVAAAIAMSAWTGWRFMDPLVALAVSAYILWGALKLGAQSLDILLDREIPDADRQRVADIALAHPEVLGLHDMRTRHGGSHYIVQFHLDLPAEISLWRSHEILDEVEDNIRAVFPRCEIIIHADPLGVREAKDAFEEARQVDRDSQPAG
jgi:ferrous-iron efflux pump FieF